MDYLTWTAQWILAGTFLASGLMKLFDFVPSIHALHDRAYAAIAMSPIRGRFVGLIEILLAIGVLLPDAIVPNGPDAEFVIVRWCAAGLAILMIAVSIYYTRRKESAALTLSIFLLAVFVIVGRRPN